MKTLIITLLFTLSLAANTDPKKDLTRGIRGLEIFSYNTKKLGKHIYVVSEMYTEKKVEFINENGLVVLSKNTVGTPITLEDLKPGVYKIKITEEDKTDIVLYELN
ncbi:hypothetical protein [Flavobacterium sp.]|uniref:hypothetical protein n=1 Tax=Flavobacterium sp. TaxID=239 RepID=UPI003D11E7FF